MDDIYDVGTDDPLRSSPTFFAMLDRSFDPVPTDDAVWAAIERTITAGRPRTATIGGATLDRIHPTNDRPPNTRRRSLLALLAVAAVVVFVAGAVLAVSDGSSPEIVAVHDLVDPATGATLMSVAIAADGTGTAANVALPGLDASSTYQLWSVVGDEVVSVGLLGPDPSDVPLRIEGEPALLALTVERSGGVAVSTQDPVALWASRS